MARTQIFDDSSSQASEDNYEILTHSIFSDEDELLDLTPSEASVTHGADEDEVESLADDESDLDTPSGASTPDTSPRAIIGSPTPRTPGAIERDQRLTDLFGPDHQSHDKLGAYRYGAKAGNLPIAKIAFQDGVQVLRILYFGPMKLKDHLVRRISEALNHDCEFLSDDVVQHLDLPSSTKQKDDNAKYQLCEGRTLVIVEACLDYEYTPRTFQPDLLYLDSGIRLLASKAPLEITTADRWDPPNLIVSIEDVFGIARAISKRYDIPHITLHESTLMKEPWLEPSRIQNLRLDDLVGLDTTQLRQLINSVIQPCSTWQRIQRLASAASSSYRDAVFSLDRSMCDAQETTLDWLHTHLIQPSPKMQMLHRLAYAGRSHFHGAAFSLERSMTDAKDNSLDWLYIHVIQALGFDRLVQRISLYQGLLKQRHEAHKPILNTRLRDQKWPLLIVFLSAILLAVDQASNSYSFSSHSHMVSSMVGSKHLSLSTFAPVATQNVRAPSALSIFQTWDAATVRPPKRSQSAPDYIAHPVNNGEILLRLRNHRAGPSPGKISIQVMQDCQLVPLIVDELVFGVFNMRFLHPPVYGTLSIGVGYPSRNWPTQWIRVEMEKPWLRQRAEKLQTDVLHMYSEVIPALEQVSMDVREAMEQYQAAAVQTAIRLYATSSVPTFANGKSLRMITRRAMQEASKRFPIVSEELVSRATGLSTELYSAMTELQQASTTRAQGMVKYVTDVSLKAGQDSMILARRRATNMWKEMKGKKRLTSKVRARMTRKLRGNPRRASRARWAMLRKKLRRSKKSGSP